MARLCPNAFPGTRRWQNAREMRSPGVRRWQGSRAMRSRALCRGKISPRCVPGRQSVAIFSLHVSPKGPRTGKSPLPGKIRAPCIRNELALAGYARHASEKPRKPPSEDTPREDLARKGPFSLHGPLESCIVRRSCHPPPNSAGDRRPYGRRNGARAASCRAGWRCRRSAWCCGVSSAGGKAGISEAPLASL